jgi:hypothetical protein
MDVLTERVLLAAEAAEAADAVASRKRARCEQSPPPSVATTSAPSETCETSAPSPTDDCSLYAADLLESNAARDLFTEASRTETSLPKQIFSYESAGAFVVNSAVDCTRIAMSEKGVRSFVESCFHGSDNGKCAVFAIYAHILEIVAYSFLDSPSKHDPKRLIASVESITKSVGQSKMKDAGAIVKIARTAHRVASRAAHNGEQLDEFMKSVDSVVSSSFSVTVTKNGAVRGACKLFRQSGRR